MPSGNLPIYAAMAIAIAGMATSALRLRTRDDRLERLSRWLSLGLLLLVTGLALYLYHLFISSDMDNFYVWQYSKVSYPLKYRLAGVLAGMDGSLLFWIWMITIPWALEELWATRRRTDLDVLDWSRIATLAIATVLLYVLSIHEIFASTPASWRALAPDGSGMSPLLQTDLMVIHPPVVFISYGVLVVPFAASMAALITGKRGWAALSTPWSRVGWLFLTAGIGIGGMWAYVVLGWGGYWGWDPVETSSLLPWLLLTGSLHALMMNRRKGQYPLAAPILGVMTFVLVVFATFATRAGGLWVSVHTFPGETAGPVSDRFMDLMRDNPTVRVYFVLMVAVVAITVALALRAHRRGGRAREDRYISLAELIDDDMLMYATVAMLVLLTTVTFVILLGGVNGLSADNFNTPLGVLTVVGLLVLLVCLVWRSLGRRRVAMLAGATALASGIGAALFPDDVSIASTAPVLLVALAGALYRAVRSIDTKRLLPSLSVAGAHVVHVALVLILLGYAGSNFLMEERTLPLEVGGDAQAFGGYEFRAVDFRQTTDERYVVVEVLKDGDLKGSLRPGQSLMEWQGYIQQRSEIKVLGRALEDVYLTYQNTTIEGTARVVNVVVKVLPLMNALWGGMWLMMAGIVLRAGAETASRDRRRRAAGAGHRDAAGRGRGTAARRGRDRRGGRRRGAAAGRRRADGRSRKEGGPDVRGSLEGLVRGPEAEEAEGEEEAEETEGEEEAEETEGEEEAEETEGEEEAEDAEGGEEAEGEEGAKGEEEEEEGEGVEQDEDARLGALLEEELKRI